MRIKKSLSILFVLMFLPIFADCHAADFTDTSIIPKKPAYRLGTGDKPEQEYKVIEGLDEKQAKIKREYVMSKSYADSTLKDLSREVINIADIDKENMLEDISILWSGAASKSETVKFTMYKLANPDADKPDKSVIQKVIRPLAGFTSMAGAGFLNPVAATTAIMSGALVNSLSADDKELNYKYTKVTDADMIMLMKRVDDLQTRLVSEYVDYMTAYKNLDLTAEVASKFKSNIDKLKDGPKADLLIADSYYHSILENKKRAETVFLAKRAALEQTAGPEAIAEFEAVLAERRNTKE